MKIGHAEPPVAAPPTTGRSASADAAKPASGQDGVESSAKVELSHTAASLRSGTPQASADFDADKVARISQAISDGSFKINPEAIADKLIANAQEVLTKVSR